MALASCLFEHGQTILNGESILPRAWLVPVLSVGAIFFDGHGNDSSVCFLRRRMQDRCTFASKRIEMAFVRRGSQISLYVDRAGSLSGAAAYGRHVGSPASVRSRRREPRSTPGMGRM
jgi:hypothetical protein